SPGNLPSHFGAKPLHIPSPTSVVITPMIKINLPRSRMIQKVARIERRHKLESKCQYSFEIITRHSESQKRRPRTRFEAHFAHWRGNTIRTSPKIKRPPKKKSRKSTKPKRWL